jgi:L-lactate dehydrogenase complex protein LldF
VSHAEQAAAFLRDAPRSRWHDASLWSLREKRDRAAASVPDWEALREAAEAVKRHTLEHLPFYLARFEQRARSRGAVVHWARDAQEHNRIVAGLLREAGAARVVKSKSMLTEECGLNEHLEAHGIEVTDTDLGERIVQLRHEPPSHIVMPAIHLRRAEIGALFHAELGTPEGLDDPTRLTEAARAHLRPRFLAAQAGLTGVNFAIAETGGIVVCTNEGNADLGTLLPPLHIASLGIEKLIPRAVDVPVFLRLLARSATGQAQTAYTSHFHGPRPGGALHLVLVDNGRSALRRREDFAEALACIRCGACMNTCPVFRRSGGHSYAAVIPGPIGSVLEPSRAPARHASLPYACSLCGSCRDVCPVRIDLPKQLLAWRGELLAHAPGGAAQRAALRLARFAFERPRLYEVLGALARIAARHLPEGWLSGRWNAWTRGRALPVAPRESFRALARRQPR